MLSDVPLSLRSRDDIPQICNPETRQRELQAVEVRLLLGSRIAALAVLQFVGGLVLAISLHPKGFNPRTEFLSILGTRAHPYPWVFNGALLLLGAGLVVFFATLLQLSWHARNGLAQCSGWGLASSCSLCLTALVPWTRGSITHILAFAGWIVLMIPMSEAWLRWVFEWFPTSWMAWLFNRVVVVSLVLYVPFALAGFGPFWQKIVVAVAFVWITLFIVQVRRLMCDRGGFRLQMNRWEKLKRELDEKSLPVATVARRW